MILHKSSSYLTIDAALALPERSDRVIALHDAFRKATDKEMLISALINRLANEVQS